MVQKSALKVGHEQIIILRRVIIFLTPPTPILDPCATFGPPKRIMERPSRKALHLHISSSGNGLLCTSPSPPPCFARILGHSISDAVTEMQINV